MKMRIILRFTTGLLLLICLVSCNGLWDGESSGDIPPVATPESLESPTAMANQSWVIVGKERAEEVGLASWLLESDSFWTPSDDDILKLEEKLAEYLRQNSTKFYRQPPVWERLDAYQRQYVGFGREGKQMIYGNFFCNSEGIDWRQNLVIVDDGGECYFQFEYDIEGEVFIKLMVNGES